MANKNKPNASGEITSVNERPRRQPTTRDGKTGSLAEGKYAREIDIANVAATSDENVEDKRTDRSS